MTAEVGNDVYCLLNIRLHALISCIINLQINFAGLFSPGHKDGIRYRDGRTFLRLLTAILTKPVTMLSWGLPSPHWDHGYSHFMVKKTQVQRAGML